MPVNRNALIRYKTIDNCLRNRFRKWTLNDLIDACSEALYEYEGINKGISRRTIQMDIQIMRSEKLGYNAPIIVKDRKYYEYEDPEYSITNTPLSPQDMETISDSVAILKELSGFSLFSGMEDIVGKLEDHISAVRHKKEPIIYYEKNESLKGLHFITPLYDTIVAKRPIMIRYQSFKAQSPNDFVFSPYVLKEFRNRWFVFGQRKGMNMVFNLALDRIISLTPAPTDDIYIDPQEFDPKTYFDDIVGVTKGKSDKSTKVSFWASKEQVPYIETKPLHSSQKIIEINEDGSAVFQIKVILNFEIERDLLSYGEGIKVITPRILVRHIERRLRAAAAMYD